MTDASEAGLTDRDFASLVLGSLDYEAQLAAIRGLLERHRAVDAELLATVEGLNDEARRLGGLDERGIDEWLEHMHASVFQGAAHSMAAVGMLAPLIESIFKSAFSGIRAMLAAQGDGRVQSVRPHMREDQRWDCQFARGGGKDLVRGVMELADELGIAPDLPADLRATLEALVGYRNKMFHLGFEWPDEERLRFGERAQRDWPADWFTSAKTDGRPWIFYMTDAFVDHCLGTADAILEGLGRFVRRNPTVVQLVGGAEYDY